MRGALIAVLALTVTPARAAPLPVTVFAAASLARPFRALAAEIERQHPDWHVELNLAGSQQLAMQIEQGARADVFAAADRQWPAYLAQRGLLAEAPRDFAHNRLVLVTPAADPGHVRTLRDLARPGVKLVLGTEAVPIGRYARRTLTRLGNAPGFGADYAAHALRNVVSEEEDVSAVLAKVRLGEADAAFVYRSDVAPEIAGLVRTLEVPPPYAVEATYAAGIPKNAAHPAAARAVVALLLSPDGQRLLRAQRLLPLAED